MSATAAGMKPAMVPFSIRRSSKCQAVPAKPIKAMTTAMPNPDRSSITLRPYRSANPPHKG